MELKELDKTLRNYTEDELFYKEYFESKKDKNQYNTFIECIPTNFIKEHRLILPELMDYSFGKIMKEDTFLEINADIQILKHFRYTPEFYHSHKFFEMVYVYSGTCAQNINGTTLTFNEGDICIIAPDTAHSISVFDDSIILNILICKSTFTETFFQLLKENNILSEFFLKILYTNKGENYIIFRTNRDITLKNIILKMINEQRIKKKYGKKIINNMLMIFFAYLLQGYENYVEIPSRLAQQNSNLISNLLAYIEEHYNSITLNELANTFHFSNTYLSKLIKNSTGENFCKIVKNIKLRKACDLLEFTNMSIYQISNEIGYSSEEHYIRTFKSEFNISPTKYRKNPKPLHTS